VSSPSTPRSRGGSRVRPPLVSLTPNVTKSHRPSQIATRLLRMCASKGGGLCRPEPAGRYNSQGVSDPGQRDRIRPARVRRGRSRRAAGASVAVPVGAESACRAPLFRRRCTRRSDAKSDVRSMVIRAMELRWQFARLLLPFLSRLRTAGHHAIESRSVLGTVKTRRSAPPARLWPARGLDGACARIGSPRLRDGRRRGANRAVPSAIAARAQPQDSVEFFRSVERSRAPAPWR
jgi:hypothetical protein